MRYLKHDFAQKLLISCFKITNPM